ncbi:MAG: hypothetical protein KDA80_22800, partial [Planctomycetaceae bacterium]|nr:hypothetical protein [Planctomycetaceae bacterium]
MRLVFQKFRYLWLSVIYSLLSTGMVRGDEPAEKPQPEQQASEQSGSEQSGSELSDLEQAFVALLDGAVLNG